MTYCPPSPNAGTPGLPEGVERMPNVAASSQKNVTDETSPVQIAPASAQRQRLIIRNAGPHNAYILTVADQSVETPGGSGLLLTPNDPPLILLGSYPVYAVTGAASTVAQLTIMAELAQ